MTLERYRPFANLKTLESICGASGIRVHQDGNGVTVRDIEKYDLYKTSSGKWELTRETIYSKGIGNWHNTVGQPPQRKVVATIPNLEDAVTILRAVCEHDLKPRYKGSGASYKIIRGDHGLDAVERSLRKQPLSGPAMPVLG